jgi:hypothetical protein
MRAHALRHWAGFVAALVAVVLAGCGGGSDEGTPALTGNGPPGDGGRPIRALRSSSHGR